jgi:hypothetical protein
VYAGSEGTITTTTISLHDPNVVDLAPMFNNSGDLITDQYREPWKNTIETETLETIRTQSLPYGDARAKAWKLISGNTRNILKTNEILIKGNCV